MGFLHKLHAHVVHDSFLKYYSGEFLRHLSGGLKKNSIRVFHYIGFVYGGDFLTPIFPCVIESEAHDSLGREVRDRLQTYSSVAPDFSFFLFPYKFDEFLRFRKSLSEFYSRIEVFGIFSYNYEVDVLVSRAYSGIPLRWPQTGVKVERFPYGHTDAAKSGTDRRGYWSL